MRLWAGFKGGHEDQHVLVVNNAARILVKNNRLPQNYPQVFNLHPGYFILITFLDVIYSLGIASNLCLSQNSVEFSGILFVCLFLCLEYLSQP